MRIANMASLLSCGTASGAFANIADLAVSSLNYIEFLKNCSKNLSVLPSPAHAVASLIATSTSDLKGRTDANSDHPICLIFDVDALNLNIGNNLKTPSFISLLVTGDPVRAEKTLGLGWFWKVHSGLAGYYICEANRREGRMSCQGATIACDVLVDCSRQPGDAAFYW
ncbi:hypothetical protein EDD22DRAFT_851812 [Suillus occidentalis]|nr:hypothetical protein EDD22DRAFT_851812 [Suillus occidentalis]